MSKSLTILILCAIAMPVTACAQQIADLVLANGAVYTVDPQRSWASAVAVKDGRIIYVGDDGGALRHLGADTRFIDLDGRMLMPGFHDSHAHPMAAGTRFLRCALYGLTDAEAVLTRLRACAESLPQGQWLRSIGLEAGVFPDGGPHRRQLDVVTGDRPAVVSPDRVNRIWVNSAALAAAGIGIDEATPLGGEIGRDPATGEPNGLLAGTALGLVWVLASNYRHDEYLHALRKASAMANRFGITSVVEAAAESRHWLAYRAADQAGEMTLRAHASLSWNPDAGPEQLAELLDMLNTPAGRRFRSGSVKLKLDGNSIERASLLEPGSGGGRGISNYGDQLQGIVARLDALGIDVHMHALGDRAVRDGLDAIAHAIAVNPPRERRHHMAHLSLIAPSDLPRFAALGVTADVQPVWAYWNDERAESASVLGADRAGRLNPVRSLFESGARVVAGSDWISESMNPLVGIQYAVTRSPLDGSGASWIPGEVASLDQMLAAYTIDGAWIAGLENETGSIEVGKAADLVVLERNLFEVPAAQIAEVSVLLTLLEGEEVYRDPAFASLSRPRP